MFLCAVYGYSCNSLPFLPLPLSYHDPEPVARPLLSSFLGVAREPPVPEAERAVYRPRHPEDTAFYKVLAAHFDEFEGVYPSRYESRYGYWRPVVGEVVRKYLTCGILRYGFARVKCRGCKKEYLLAFSCKGRHFCPSCHQRRVLEFGEMLRERILEKVPHRQIVFTIPKMLRVYFRYHRALLSRLANCAFHSLRELYQTALARTDSTPGAVITIHTFGSLVNFHPHLHCLVPDGAFGPNGTFSSLPRIPREALEKLFQHKTLTMLLAEGLITEKLVRNLLSWRRSGFNVHVGEKALPEDEESIEKLAQYIVRAPLAQERMSLSPDGRTVIYRSQMRPGAKRNFEVFNTLDWLAAITSHIPEKGQKMTLYYGWYAQASRGKRRRQGRPSALTTSPADPDCSPKELRHRWAHFIKNLYTDPLICPRCGSSMRIISFIEQAPVIEKILRHLHLWDSQRQEARPPPEDTSAQPELCYEPFLHDMPVELEDQVLN